MKKHFIYIMASVVCATFMIAQNVNAQKYNNIKYSAAVKADAENGNAEAQYVLGVALCLGEGVKEDNNKGLSWLKKSAAQKCPMAMRLLGAKHEVGDILPKDSVKATNLYKAALPLMKKLASRGNALAQRDLAKMYESGQGVKQDYKTAVYWYTKSAQHGYDYAQGYLGWMYFNGKGVKADTVKAIYWLNKSAKQGNRFFQNFLGWMYGDGKGVKQDNKKARYWFEKAALQGDQNAQNDLGIIYTEGKGVKQDYKKAVYWFYKSAQQGFQWAQYNLGEIYDNGKDSVKQNYKKARYWYAKAAYQGNEDAQTRLGIIYATGTGVNKNEDKAINWFSKLTDKKDADVSYYKLSTILKSSKDSTDNNLKKVMGDMFFNGRGVPRNFKHAEEFYDGNYANKEILKNISIISNVKQSPIFLNALLIIIILVVMIIKDYTKKDYQIKTNEIINE